MQSSMYLNCNLKMLYNLREQVHTKYAKSSCFQWIALLNGKKTNIILHKGLFHFEYKHTLGKGWEDIFHPNPQPMELLNISLLKWAWLLDKFLFGQEKMWKLKSDTKRSSLNKIAFVSSKALFS